MNTKKIGIIAVVGVGALALYQANKAKKSTAATTTPTTLDQFMNPPEAIHNPIIVSTPGVTGIATFPVSAGNSGSLTETQAIQAVKQTLADVPAANAPPSPAVAAAIAAIPVPPGADTTLVPSAVGLVPAFIIIPTTPAWTYPPVITLQEFNNFWGGTAQIGQDARMQFIATHPEWNPSPMGMGGDYEKYRVLIAQRQHGIIMNAYAPSGGIYPADVGPASEAEAYIDSIGGLVL